MEIEILKNEKDCVEFKLVGERHTFPNLLVHELLKDDKVVFAAYRLEHPHDPDSTVIVKTKGKTASKVLLDACRGVTKELSEFQKEIRSAFKK
jgi:DNA-directed RNA polymerase II subunit RPB11